MFAHLLPPKPHLKAALACSLTLFLAVGCDSGPRMATVSGKVTYQGDVVPKGTVTFYPVGGGRPSSGQIQPDGTYELASTKPGDGAVLGDYRVAIKAVEVKNAPPAPKSFADELASENAPPPRSAPKTVWLVPEEYASAESSGLTATVEDKQNVIDFDLK